MPNPARYLVDSCIWVDYFHHNDPLLADALMSKNVVTHPSIIAEIMLGSLPHRRDILDLLLHLPCTPLAKDDELLTLIEAKKLYSRGIGYVDAHLIASLLLAPDVRLWTRDKRLAAVAREHQLLFETVH